MAIARLKLLGAFEARLPSGVVVTGLPRKARALLAFLALTPGRPHERDTLATLLWGDSSDRAARHSLRQTLSLLRRRVPGVLVDGDAIRLATDGFSVDAADFERLAARRDAESLATAERLYTGELLPGFHVDAEPFVDWLRGKREALHERAIETLAQLLGSYTRNGAIADAIRVALRLLELDPLQEAVHRALMRLYVRQGRRAAALNQYEILVERLRAEGSVAPEAETRALYQAVLRRGGPVPPRAVPVSEWQEPESGRIDPPLLGREIERLRLETVAGDVRRRGSAAVILLAEAGGGKTRLLGEVMSTWTDRGGRVLLGRCREIQRTVPMAVWSDALKSGTRPPDIEKLFAGDHPARRQLSRLLPELGGPARDLESSRRDRTGLFDAVVDLLTRLAAERPLMVALEDLHWADLASLELVDHVVRRRVTAPLLLLFTARDEELVDATGLDALIHELSRERALESLRLPPLTPELVGRLVASLAGDELKASELERLSSRAWRMSEGNPFLAVEATRESTTTPRRAASGSPVSDRARRVLGARVDRLSAAARHVADLAAVLGREFEFTVIARAAGLRPRDAAGVVDELVRRRVFRSLGERLEFTHDLLREIIASEVAARAVPALHRAVATALARRADRDAPTLSKRLAHHYAKANMPAKAVDWLERYADQSLRILAPDEAILAIEQALSYVATLHPSRRGRRRLALLLNMAPALAMTGRFREILSRLRPEETVVREIGDDAVAARYYFRVVLTQSVLEDEERLDELSAEGLGAAERSGDPAALGRLLFAVSGTCVAAGRPRHGIEHAERAVALLQRAGDQRWLALALWILSVHRLVLGELDAAHDAAARSTRVGIAAGDAGLASFGVTMTAWTHLQRGDLDAADACCHDALRSPGEPLNTVTALGLMAIARIERGEPAAAIPVLEQVVEQLPTPVRREIFVIPLGAAYVEVGMLERAHAVSARAHVAAEGSPSRWRRGRAGQLAALIAEAEGRSEEADRLFAGAVADLDAVPAPLEVARMHGVAGRLALARGDHPMARRHLATARDGYVALGLPLRVASIDGLRAKCGS
jgi:DNA-binding SARP family transcriptional activator